jgi:hypothetical protein
MWLELLRLSKEAPAPWTLIGAHMVALHGRVVSQGTALVSHGLLAPPPIATDARKNTTPSSRLVRGPTKGREHAIHSGPNRPIFQRKGKGLAAHLLPDHAVAVVERPPASKCRV